MSTSTDTSARLRTSVAALVVALTIAPAAGQVAPVRGGRELDTNYRVGTAGVNDSIGGYDYRPQDIVTGQVSGLGRFQAQLPYAAADELRLSGAYSGSGSFIPSADSFSGGNFRRQSIGLEDVVAGRAYGMSRYLESTRTVMGLESIRRGQTLPGSNLPARTAVDDSVTRRLFDEVRDRYSTEDLSDRGELLSVRLRADPVEVPSHEMVPRARVDAARQSPRMVMVSQPGASALLGVLQPVDRMDLARELYLLRRQGLPGRQRGEMEPRGDEAEVRRLREGTFDDPFSPEFDPSDANAVRVNSLPDQRGMGTQRGGTYVMPRNEDVFVEILAMLAQTQATFGEGDQPWFRLTAPRKGRQGIVEVTEDNDLIVHSLAGVGTDQFNRRMEEAEQKLRAGRYYDAAAAYEVAIVIDRANPLARLGLGIALVAADEPRSAAVQIARGLEMFPGLAEVRFDVEGMLGEKVVQARLAGLRESIAKAREQDAAAARTELVSLLCFLQTFLQRQLGNDAAAREAASDLKQCAPDNELFGRFAEYVLTGDWPKDAQGVDGGGDGSTGNE
jgi:hypothetical protein